MRARTRRLVARLAIGDPQAEHEGDVDAESEELAAAKEAVEAAKAALGDEEE